MNHIKKFHLSSGGPISANDNGDPSEKITALMATHGIISPTITLTAANISGVKTGWQVFLISFRIFVLVSPSGMGKMRLLRSGYLVWVIIREIMGKM